MRNPPTQLRFMHIYRIQIYIYTTIELILIHHAKLSLCLLLLLLLWIVHREKLTDQSNSTWQIIIFSFTLSLSFSFSQHRLNIYACVYAWVEQAYIYAVYLSLQTRILGMILGIHLNSRHLHFKFKILPFVFSLVLKFMYICCSSTRQKWVAFDLAQIRTKYFHRHTHTHTNQPAQIAHRHTYKLTGIHLHLKFIFWWNESKLACDLDYTCSFVPSFACLRFRSIHSRSYRVFTSAQQKSSTKNYFNNNTNDNI